MSRTIRRTKEKRLGRSNKLKSYVFKYVPDWNDTIPMYETCLAFPKQRLEGKEFDEAYWRFHRDSKKYYGWQLLKGGKISSRAFNEHELIKGLKDPEYVPAQKRFHDARRFHRWANPWECK